MAKIYSANEISQHSEENDLWMVIHGGVYDLTKFLKEHPGGEEVLINLAGKDGSQCFDDIGHSYEAITLRESFKIGETNEMPSENTEKNKPISSDHSNNDNDNNWQYEESKKETSSSFFFPIAMGLTVLIYAIIFYRVYF
ncbi:cytochrome b5-like [Leptopilina boulardi]|uniref:cytochrome b5-like n=1 Tax=Leptopilina boulardi TaxID=63433 RepID=UPI0021F5905A|nr:cytochrome b5-like [Leptopilina boulardi]XP_051171808.1 cytochrome b5-like [Leptopilina boulardi]XP_051171809.1 cytochrome b5-like [Leptopilina boulardi]